MVFQVTTDKRIFDIKEFCRLQGELIYVGEFANKQTSRIIPGTIVQFRKVFYTTGYGGLCSGPADIKGKINTTLILNEMAKYVPKECKPVADCPILIYIWDINLDDEGPIASYAFYKEELEKAKKLVEANADIEIFIDGEEVSRAKFLEEIAK